MENIVRDNPVKRPDAAEDIRAAELAEADSAGSGAEGMVARQGIRAQPVGRLVVAHRLEIASYGGGAGVEEGTLDAVPPNACTLNPIQPGAGQEHGRDVTGLSLSKGADARAEFLAGGDAVGQEVVCFKPREAVQRSLEVLRLRRPRISECRETQVLVENDHVPGTKAVPVPSFDLVGDVRLV